MTKRGLMLAVTCAALALAGCRSAPVMNVADAAVGVSLSAQQLEQAIVAAGDALGWQMRPTGPGRIEGTLLLRDHRAVVDINYSPRSYSIRYKDSSNLHYDDGGTIHRNYNRWIENLDRAIRVRVS